MGLVSEIPVFIETNLGTRIVVPISPEITALSLKREVERAHTEIFPELGFLSIRALMVKRNSHYYRLPDSFSLKYASQWFQNFWLFHADASLVDKLEKTSLLGSVVSKRRAGCRQLHNGKEVIRKKKKKKRLLNGRVLMESFGVQGPEKKGCELRNVAETRCDGSPEGISISAIIDRYFADFVEVGPVGSALCSEPSMRFGQLESKTGQTEMCSPLPEDLSRVGLKRYERSEVGKRLVTASNSLSRCHKSCGSSHSIGKSLRGSDAGCIVRNLVFEINDND